MTYTFLLASAGAIAIWMAAPPAHAQIKAPHVAAATSPLSPECRVLTEAENLRINDLIRSMSVAEKIAQMRIFHAKGQARLVPGSPDFILHADGTLDIPPAMEARFQQGIAGIKNPGEFMDPVSAAKFTNALQRKIIAASPHHIPAMFVAEAYNGLDADGATRFSRPITMASTWNPRLVKKVWDVIGREARLHGFHMIHSPVADIHRDPRFGRMSEGFGEDTYLTSTMATAAVQGVQGDQQGLSKTHVGAVVKHFAGYGQADGGRNFASIRIPERELHDEILPPYKSAITQGCALGMMPSHGDINGVASHGNHDLLTSLLRRTWGFDGYVVSDAEDVARLNTLMGVAENEDAAAVLGLHAGIDIDLYSDTAYANLPKLARQDPSIMPSIDNAVRRVLSAKLKLGLLDHPYADPRTTAEGTRTKTALDLALQLDLESATLLKNRNNLLPLQVGLYKKIALLGPLLDTGTTIRRRKSPGTLAEFKKIFPEKTQFVQEAALQLTNSELANPQLIALKDNQAGIDHAVNLARASDLVILFLGDTEFTAKEAYFRGDTRGDRAQLDLVGQQDLLFNTIKDLGKPVIVILKNRRTLTINAIAAKADAILDVWETGERGDEAIAMLLTGAANPSGKLPVSVPRNAGQMPIHYSQKRINFYRHYLFDEDGMLFPFGFGLSYTNFRYSDIQLSSKTMTPDAPITASVTVTNTGQRAGQEVVQLYITDPFATVMRPVRELKGFEKIALAPGESRSVTFHITPNMMAHLGADMRIDPGFGEVIASIGSSSATHTSGSFRWHAEK